MRLVLMRNCVAQNVTEATSKRQSAEQSEYDSEVPNETMNTETHSMRLLAAVVAHWPDKADDGPGHRHNIKGRWDKDGSECQWCKTWQEIRAAVAANTKVCRESESNENASQVTLEWHPGPAIGGGGTAQDERPGAKHSWWNDGDLLLILVELQSEDLVRLVRVNADGYMLCFQDPDTEDDVGYSADDISWWSKVMDSLPTNDQAQRPGEQSKTMNEETK